MLECISHRLKKQKYQQRCIIVVDAFAKEMFMRYLKMITLHPKLNKLVHHNYSTFMILHHTMHELINLLMNYPKRY